MQRTCFWLILIAIPGTLALFMPPSSVQAQSIPFPWQPPRSSPFEPPEANDHTFVVDDIDTVMPQRAATAGGFVTVVGSICVERIEVGPLRIEIPVTRVVGEINADGTLVDPLGLVEAGVISRYAKLHLLTWDVDSEIVPGEQLNLIGGASQIIDAGILPERDEVSFNGVKINRSGTTLPFLDGQHNKFVLNEFDVPIELVKFPRRAEKGSAPVPAENIVTIEWDVANIGNFVDHPLYPAPGLDNFWCALIDWAALSFQATSPVLLVHGNNQSGAFFDNTGFAPALRGLGFLVDGCGACPNPINLPADSVERNAVMLDTLYIPDIVQSYGADGVHLIGHSRGGLDLREYLASYQPIHDEEFEVLSYTSLSTPHNGTVLADILLEWTVAGLQGRQVEFKDFPRTIDDLVGRFNLDEGHRASTIGATQSFNETNLPLLTLETDYNTVAADADRNGSQTIDDFDEYAAIRPTVQVGFLIDLFFSSDVEGQIISAMDRIYQTGRLVRRIEVQPAPFNPWRRVNQPTPIQPTVIMRAVPIAQPLGNDVLVTIISGHGEASMELLTLNSHTFAGIEGRNHASVADPGAAKVVAQWLLQTEKEIGDLKE